MQKIGLVCTIVAVLFIICMVLWSCGHNWPVEPTDNQRQWQAPGIEQRLNNAINEERAARDHT